MPSFKGIYRSSTGEEPVEELLEGYAREMSLSPMTRVATETRSRETAGWVSGHVRPEQRYRPHLGAAYDTLSSDG